MTIILTHVMVDDAQLQVVEHKHLEEEMPATQTQFHQNNAASQGFLKVHRQVFLGALLLSAASSLAVSRTRGWKLFVRDCVTKNKMLREALMSWLEQVLTNTMATIIS